MAPPTLIRKLSLYFPASLLLVLLVSLHLMSNATQESSELATFYSWLILFNVAATLFLFGLLLVNLRSIWVQFKLRAIGSRLTARVLSLLLAVSLIPTSIVFFYSMQLLHRSIDSWFDVQIDTAMQDALELSQTALDIRTRTLLNRTTDMAEQLALEPEFNRPVMLNKLREFSEANEFTLLSKQGGIIATSNIDPGVLIPNRPDEAIQLQLKQNGSYIGLDPMIEEGLHVRALVTLPAVSPEIYLQALYPVPKRLSELAFSVESSYAAYRELSYLRNSLKFSFSLTLSLVLILTLLAASWVAFIFARQLVEPIRQLVKGTRDIAKGDYEKRLPVKRKDELGYLIESFNEMTMRIANARDLAQSSQRDAEDQHAYLETILSNLSNGVLSFDLSYRLRTVNKEADRILGWPMTHFIGHPLSDIGELQPEFSELVALLSEKLPETRSEWQQEMIHLGPNGKQNLLCRGTRQLASDGAHTGYVVVFDDVTPIIQSQKNAAWSEVARRLAHEIKNPLTPIQLSAERLQRKLKPALQPQDQEMLRKATGTIVQQVDALKCMVNDFSEFARPPVSKPQTLRTAQFIEEVLALYQGQIANLVVHVDPDLPSVYGDPIRLRQVLINLIKNGQEAIAENRGDRIEVSAHALQDGEQIEIRVRDNGPGIDKEYAHQIFEPYVTNKSKGTGLGLAIVKKIIEEHGGNIRVESTPEQGACFIIRLPTLIQQAHQTHADDPLKDTPSHPS